VYVGTSLQAAARGTALASAHLTSVSIDSCNSMSVSGRCLFTTLLPGPRRL